METKKRELYTRIYKTAADEFATFGYAGARMDRIAETAGVNKATIYYHIGNKKILYSRTVEYLIECAAVSLEALLPENLSSREASPGEVLHGRPAGEIPGEDSRDKTGEQADREFQRYIEILGTTIFGDLKLPLIMMREIVSGKEYLQQETIGKFMALFAPVITMITRGQAKGRFRNKSPLLVHFMAVAGIYFFTAGNNFLLKQSRITESGLPERILQDRKFLFSEIGDILLHGLAES
jgi:AcrR family transcriptional regulator